MVIISGQVETKDLIGKSKTRQIGIQANILDLIKPITKYSKLLIKIRIKFDLKSTHVNEGRPGPVWIDILMCNQKISDSKVQKF